MKRKREGEEVPDLEEPSPKRKKRTLNAILVSGLPSHVSEMELSKYMKEIGTVEKMIFLKDKSKTSKCDTVASVFFSGVISDDVLDYDGATILNSLVRIRFLKKKDFVIELKGVDMDIKDLKEIVTEAGKVSNVTKLEKLKYSVEFETIEGVKEILLYSGADIRGRVVSITYPTFLDVAPNDDEES